MPINPAQCRAARALLNWSQEELVENSKTTRKIVANFERGATSPHPRNMTLITAAFESQGIKFLKRNGEGVLLTRKPPGR
jgi:transcriptional regulator with XRE-family HTH domain